DAGAADAAFAVCCATAVCSFSTMRNEPDGTAPIASKYRWKTSSRFDSIHLKMLFFAKMT
ncbi:MAG: hypothetical protein Q8N79_08550, partial [Candidatus Methanoperedens sp.]|nr:hypothetical protein [Candidatus Methanoperedens sp.]